MIIDNQIYFFCYSGEFLEHEQSTGQLHLAWFTTRLEPTTNFDWPMCMCIPVYTINKKSICDIAYNTA